MAAAATVMADQLLESRVARLESDVTHIRSDIADIKIDVRELRQELGGLRKEFWGQLDGLRKEFWGQLDGLREQIQNSNSSTSLKLAELDHKLTRGISSTRIWMLLQSAALLGVMARAFGWL